MIGIQNFFMLYLLLSMLGYYARHTRSLKVAQFALTHTEAKTDDNYRTSWHTVFFTRSELDIATASRSPKTMNNN